MQTHAKQVSIVRLADVLCVSRSGYYAWKQGLSQPKRRWRARQARDEQVKLAFEQSKQRYGSPRIQAQLEAMGSKHDIKTIAASMKRQGLVAKAAKRFKLTTDSDHKLPIAPNLLNREFEAKAPNQKWAGDITYLMTNEGWLYLAVIIDLYSRSVIGWSMGPRMKAGLVCDALKMALWRRGFPKGVLTHSDRGSQYASKAYRKIIADHGLVQSMSRKGNCWDNACVESFFHSLKVETIIDEPLINRKQMKQAIFEYIEIDYNRTRRHSALGYLSPEQFEKLNVA